MSTTPLTNITNPPRCPLEDDIGTFITDDEQPAAKVASPITQIRSGGGGGGRSAGRGISAMLGNIAKRYIARPKEKGVKVTLPWLRWFNFIDEKVVQSTETQFVGEPFFFDFGDVDYFSNAGGPGAGSSSAINAETNHTGIVRLTTDVNIGDIYASWVPVQPAGIVLWAQLVSGRFIFRTPPTLTTARFEVGMSSDPSAGWPAMTFESASDMVYLFYDTAVDNALRVKARAGGVQTQSLVIVDPCPASTWVDVTFTRRLLNSAFVLDVLINGVGITTFETGLPADTVAVGSMFRIGTRVAAARIMDVDFAELKPVQLGQRFDGPL